MDTLTDMIKDQVKGLNDMYRIGYEAGVVEGKRLAWAEIKKELDKVKIEVSK